MVKCGVPPLLIGTDRPMQLPSYAIVTPVRDEAGYIAQTIESVIAQSHRPARWVIVDDGSTDQTPAIVRASTSGVNWISVLSTGSQRRNLGSAEIVAFAKGLATIQDMTFDYLVKLDGDVRLERDYFKQILDRMSSEPRWGIASGVYCEEMGGRWMPVKMPAYHAAGASKVIRRECYQEIGGFVPRKGWDTVDEIRAGLNGWKTGHFPDIQFRHLKPEGVAMGALSTHRFHGEIYYQTGGGVPFLLAKSLHRMCTAKPLLLGGLAMVMGYLAAQLGGTPRLVSTAEARFYRRMLNRRLLNAATRRGPP